MDVVDDESEEMNTMLMLDSMCNRYHCLPSEALVRATTIDLYILSQTLGYYHRKKNPDNAGSPEYSQEQLLDILNKTKANS
jgi:hypothetical protein